MRSQRGISIWVYIASGVLAFILSVLVNPLWLTLQNIWAYTNYTLIVSAVLLLIGSGVLHLIRRAPAIKILMAIVGFVLLCTMFRAIFPILDIPLY